MSVDFCDARQGGGAYGKTPAARPSSCSWSFAHMFLVFCSHVLGLLLTCSWSFAHMFFPALSPDSVDNRAAVFV
ncbi:hypothetical protein [Escherichia coli]|uniref:hypothetical protein n=1 Tax=Escherichia coli TaxID=562 RepID=UPI003D6A2F47